MAIFFDAPVSPDDVTTFIRELPSRNATPVSDLFPTRTVDDNSIDFGEIIHTNRTAQYRSFDGRIHVSERDSSGSSRVALAPLSSSSPTIGEYERLQMQFARVGGTNTAALVNAIYNDSENLVGEVRNRIELAWGDVLTDGKLTINENGLVSEADYGVPANHLVTAATLWTSAAAPALDNLIAWADVYNDTNGFLPGQLSGMQRVLRLLQTNTQIINAVAGSAAGRSRVTLTELNDLLSSEGLPTWSTFETRSLSVNGVTTPVLPSDRVWFLPPNVSDLGYTAYGLSATALELVNSNESELDFADAPGVVGCVIKGGPPFRQHTFVDAVGQPVLANARLLFVADVA